MKILNLLLLVVAGTAIVIFSGCESKKFTIKDLKDKLIHQKDLTTLSIRMEGSEEALMNFVRDDVGTYGDPRFLDFFIRDPLKIDSIVRDSTSQVAVQLADFWRPSNIREAINTSEDDRVGFTVYFNNVDSVFKFSQYYLNEVLAIDPSQELIFKEAALD